MSDLFFHIGLHKTGTTYLQREYFPLLPINYMRGSDAYFKLIREMGSSQEKILISEENLSGELFSTDKLAQFKSTVKAIAESHPNATILIGFRKHADFLLSAYKQLLHQGGVLSFNEFFNLSNEGILSTEDINFKNMIDYLNEHFKNVFIYTIDDVRDIKKFDKAVSKLLGVNPVDPSEKQKQINKSIKSTSQVKLLLKMNKIDARLKKVLGIKVLNSKLFKLIKFTPRKICQQYMSGRGKAFGIDNDIKEKINEEFHEDWQFILENKSV